MKKRTRGTGLFSSALFLILIVMAAMQTGCSTLGNVIDIFSGKTEQRITRTPITVYKPDLIMQVDQEGGLKGTGVSVLPLTETKSIQVWSLINIDRVEISTCSRHDVCQKEAGDGACDPKRFTVQTDWWGNPKKYMTYKFFPDSMERDDVCSNVQIAIYDKDVLAAWGYVVFRGNTENTFKSVMTCNAYDTVFDGVSVCSVKAGTIQQIRFDEKIATYRADETCGIKKISDYVFNIQPKVGPCRASFMLSDKRYHDLVINGYDEVLLRSK